MEEATAREEGVALLATTRLATRVTMVATTRVSTPLEEGLAGEAPGGLAEDPEGMALPGEIGLESSRTSALLLCFWAILHVHYWKIKFLVL